MINMFEKAIRLKLRFKTSRGIISVEDLYDLPLQELDDLHKKYLKEKHSLTEDSLLKTTTTKSSLIDLRLALIKHIVEYKLSLIEDRKSQEIKKAYKQKLLTALDHKEEEELGAKSAEDLRKELEALD